MYITSNCCTEATSHLDNTGDVDYCQIFSSAAVLSRSCLEAAFLGALVLNPLDSFADNDGDLSSLFSSARISIWEEMDQRLLRRHRRQSDQTDLYTSLRGRGQH